MLEPVRSRAQWITQSRRRHRVCGILLGL